MQIFVTESQGTDRIKGLAGGWGCTEQQKQKSGVHVTTPERQRPKSEMIPLGWTNYSNGTSRDKNQGWDWVSRFTPWSPRKPQIFLHLLDTGCGFVCGVCGGGGGEPVFACSGDFLSCTVFTAFSRTYSWGTFIATPVGSSHKGQPQAETRTGIYP